MPKIWLFKTTIVSAVIIIPVLIFFFAASNFSNEILLTISIGVSFFLILPEYLLLKLQILLQFVPIVFFFLVKMKQDKFSVE